jgi:Na+/H+ antiporter NhaC
MKSFLKGKGRVLFAVVWVLIFLIAGLIVKAKGGELVGTAWSIVPPVVAIVLALVVKEVYSSLFIGIFVGALYYTNYSIVDAIDFTFTGAMVPQLGDSWNVGILVFLVILGAMVVLMNKAGGAAAFGRWAEKNIHSRIGAQIATILLGMLIFIDDYFNCLTVGSVMRPVADKHKISRAKLAYIIDATAAPICIIAPISSWAAAVTGFVDGVDGLSLFVSAIPYNFYAFLTIAMMFTLAFAKFDYGSMSLHEMNAQLNGDLYTTPDRPYANAKDDAVNEKGRVLDLILPIVVLIIFCVIGMIYTGGFFSGDANFIDAFANSDASVGLMLGAFVAMVITIIYYLFRGVLNFKGCMEAIPEGFKAMVPAILILTFAWTIKAVTDQLGCGDYIASVVKDNAGAWMNFLPAIIFGIAVFMAFSTGTSWGTFGLLIPIVVDIFDGNMNSTLMIIAISACMAGAVCGDHCSPISDTTIMASAGAQCDHINHVSTQLPYALSVAVVSFICYIIAGFIQNAWIMLPLSIVLMVGILIILKFTVGNKLIVATKK